MPRLVHQYLLQQTRAEQDEPMRESIALLIQSQQKQTLWIKRISIVLSIFVAMQILSVCLAYSG
jgi:ubiquinone biosynthesis protein